MIALGVIPIRGLSSATEARKKVLRLAFNLHLDEVTASRLAIITSEMARQLQRMGVASRIVVAVNFEGANAGLMLGFESQGDIGGTARLQPIFDTVQAYDSEGGYRGFRGLKRFQGPAERPDEEFLEAQRALIQRPSRAEVLLQVQE